MAFNRRDFLKGTVAAGSVYLVGCQTSAQAEEEAGNNWQAPANPAEHYVPLNRSLNPEERRFVEAAVDRLIPNDELGPGALAAGVADFIDYQLGGPYGRADRWYMAGPWQNGSDDQGYQLRFSPAQLYRHCIPLVNDYCRQRFSGKAFSELAHDQQEQVLEALQEGQVPLDVFDPKAFFTMLWENTKEGFFADPMYGGNRHFVGWRLAGFPGTRYNYSPFITRYNQKYPYPPVGILGRKGIPLKEVT